MICETKYGEVVGKGGCIWPPRASMWEYIARRAEDRATHCTHRDPLPIQGATPNSYLVFLASFAPSGGLPARAEGPQGFSIGLPPPPSGFFHLIHPNPPPVSNCTFQSEPKHWLYGYLKQPSSSVIVDEEYLLLRWITRYIIISL